ncbi:uncharacterized protein [Temnothorax nylanderi]|uniref:uncharacterized protein n=1 Tax=Temnothorax nylanderi TaxID=102681 RepID=UPI003A89BC94
MAERGCGLGVAAEPGRVPPNSPLWAVSRCGLAAVTWRQTEDPVACTRVEAGDGFALVKWGQTYVAGVYISPRLRLAEYEETLENLKATLERFLPCQIIVAGDFNAKSVLCGSPATDGKGRILEEWAAGLGLVVLNTGNVQTCVRARGGPLST